MSDIVGRVQHKLLHFSSAIEKALGSTAAHNDLLDAFALVATRFYSLPGQGSFPSQAFVLHKLCQHLQVHQDVPAPLRSRDKTEYLERWWQPYQQLLQSANNSVQP